MADKECRSETAETTGAGTPIPIEHGEILDQVDRMWRKVAGRAFEIFEERGKHHGHDLDDWLAAEHELLLSIPIEIIEKRDKLIVRAEIPGFSGKNLKITLEPEKLLIKGHVRETKEGETNGIWEIFRAIDLPSGMEIEGATATLAGGVLTIELTKRHAVEESHAVTA